jgi:hypothetical protein
MSYNREDNELMITDMPRNGQILNLYTRIEPQRRHRASSNKRIPFHTIPYKIINSLIQDFQNNPIDLEEDWSNSGIPYFLSDVKRQYSTDSNVQRLFEIPNIERLRSGQMD